MIKFVNDKTDTIQLTDQARFTAIFEQSPLSIQIFSPDGKTLRVNQAWERLWGVNLEQIEGYNILEDEQLIEQGIMPYIKRAFAGEVVHAPPVFYDPEKTIPAITGNEDPQRWTKAVLYPLKDVFGQVREVILIHEDITETKKIEQKSERLTQEIEVQKKHLQELVSSVPGVVWEAWGEPSKVHQRIDFVSDYVTEMLGYTVQEWLSTPNFWLKIVHPQDREKAAAIASEHFSKGQKGTNRFRWVGKDGTSVWVESQSMVICDERGNPIGMRGVTMDITERKKKEDAERFLFEAGIALSSSLDYKKTLATVAELAVSHFADWCTVDMLDPDGILRRLAITHIKPEMVEWAEEIHSKYPPDPDAPFGIYNVVRTGESEFYPEIPDKILAERAQNEEHLRMLRQIGFKSAMLIPLKIRKRILGVITFVNSESPNHTSEDLALAEDLANRAALAVDNAKLFSAEQTIRRMAQKNSDFLRRLQAVSRSLSQALIPKEVAEAVIEQGITSLGAHAGILVLSDDQKNELNAVGSIGFADQIMEKWQRFDINQKVPLADAVRTGKPIFITSFAKFTDEYPMLGPLALVTESNALVAIPLIVKNKTIGGIGLSFREIQEFSNDDRMFLLALAQQCAQALERAKLYENEQNLRAEAEKANRIKDEFLATVSHELRTPLNAIVGWTSLLKREQLKGDQIQRAVETIDRNAKSQVQIIEDLLDVSRIITGKIKLEPVLLDFQKIVSAAVESIMPTAKAKKINIDTDLNRSLFIKGDAERLQQVLWNLLSNAIKFTPNEGVISVKLKAKNSDAVVSIKDSGQGIDPQFVPFVFDRFRQADATTTRNHGGLGLGLSIVRNLVEMHGGRVEVTSQGKDKGSTFTVKIPIVSGESFVADNTIRTDVPGDNKKPLKGVRILVVDDEKDSLELLKMIIETNGGKARSALSAQEALNLFDEFEPHLLISDIAMPEEDGYSLIQKIRSGQNKRSGIPAIALTAYTREIDKQRAIEAGFQMHIAKPIDHTQLIKAIKDLTSEDSPSKKMK